MRHTHLENKMNQCFETHFRGNTKQELKQIQSFNLQKNFPAGGGADFEISPHLLRGSGLYKNLSFFPTLSYVSLLSTSCFTITTP